MTRPWYLHAGSFSQFLPIVAALVRRERPRGPRAWILVWLGLLLIADWIALYLAIRHANNRWVSYVFTPLQALAVLWAMMLWQRGPVARLAIRNSIPLVLLVVLGMNLFENVDSFSRFTEPLLSMVTLFVALYTLTVLSSEATEPLMRQDWFWICIGVAMAYGATATLTPLAFAFVDSHPEVVRRAYQVRLVVHVLAMSALSIGILCPTSPRFSGTSSPLPQSA